MCVLTEHTIKSNMGIFYPDSCDSKSHVDTVPLWIESQDENDYRGSW